MFRQVNVHAATSTVSDGSRFRLARRPIAGSHGLGHTRWATHGPPLERNAHPIADARRRIALIHNGIIENFLPLREELGGNGARFASDTEMERIFNKYENS